MSAHTEAIEIITNDLIAIETKVVTLRAKYAEQQDAAFLAILDEITAAFESLRSSMSKIDNAAGIARSQAVP